ncbi:MAG: guanylate kinase [Lachnospiraceae bacterium]|nr:guanylate kinase [Lachnospiraceae bacterium]MCR5023812.1 guanylate kinase [Lachnospiraceae bacterium]
MRGILIVVSGFAGAGKGTIMNKLIEEYPGYALSVSATSRAPREGEKEGVNYFYKTREEFEEMIKNDELLEHAEYVGNYYGTPRAFVEKKLDEGMNVLLEIEIQGAMQIKKAFPDALLVFIMPPSAKILKERLTNRGTETPEVIDKRMKRAREESEGIESYDFIVINDEVDKCTALLHNIILSASYQPSRRREFIEQVRAELRNI